MPTSIASISIRFPLALDGMAIAEVLGAIIPGGVSVGRIDTRVSQKASVVVILPDEERDAELEALFLSLLEP